MSSSLLSDLRSDIQTVALPVSPPHSQSVPQVTVGEMQEERTKVTDVFAGCCQQLPSSVFARLMADRLLSGLAGFRFTIQCGHLSGYHYITFHFCCAVLRV